MRVVRVFFLRSDDIELRNLRIIILLRTYNSLHLYAVSSSRHALSLNSVPAMLYPLDLTNKVLQYRYVVRINMGFHQPTHVFMYVRSQFKRLVAPFVYMMLRLA